MSAPVGAPAAAGAAGGDGVRPRRAVVAGLLDSPALAAACAAARVRVRLYEPRDYDTILPIWQEGFFEMIHDLYAGITARPHVLLGAAGLGGALALGVPSFGVGLGRVLGGATLLLGAAVYTPLGRAFAHAMLRRGIAAETRASMQPHHLDPESAKAKWGPQLSSPFFVAEDADTGAVVGCVAIKPRHTLEKAARAAAWGAGTAERMPAATAATATGEASIWRLSVAPAARGRGVARALMAAAEGAAAAGGAKTVSLICGNAASQRFYRAIGYAPEEEGRARRVMFPPDGAPRGVADRLAAWHLRTSRLARDGTATLLAKRLPE